MTTAAALHGLSAAGSCALARLRAHPGRVVLAAIGVGVSVVSIVVIAFAATVAGDVALRRDLVQLDPAERAVIVAFAPEDGLDEEDLGAIDAAVRGNLAGDSFAGVRALVEFRALSNKQGDVFRVAGVGDLAAAVDLVGGRWPARCTPQRCEVVVVRSSAAADVAVELDLDPTLGLDIVGQVVATDPLLLGGGFAPESNEVVVLAGTVDGASGLQPLQYIRRSFGWIAPIRTDRLRVSDVSGLLRTMAALPGSIDRVGLEVRGPADALASGQIRARTAGNRLAVPAATSLTLFAAFVVFAGLGLRPDHRRALLLLGRRGAAPSALGLFTVLEAGWVVVVGGVLGLAAGVPAGFWLAQRAGSNGGDAFARVVDSSTLGNVALFLFAALIVLIAVMRAADPIVVRRRRVRGLDIAGVAAAAMIAVLVDRGAPSAAALAARPDTGVAAIPVLAAVVCAAVACRVVPAALRGSAALVPPSRPLLKMSLANSTARPLRPLATASLVALTVMFGVFGLGYRSTLALGARDQSAFAVPYDFRITGGAALVRPSAVAPEAGWNSLAPGLSSTPVLRRGTVVRVAGFSGSTAEVVGLDPTTLASLHGWRADFGAAPDTLAAQLDMAAPKPFGTTLPAEAIALTIATSGLDGTAVSVVVQQTTGRWHELPAIYRRSGDWVVELEANDAGGRLIGFRVGQDIEAASRTEHHIGEGDTSVGALLVTGSIDSISWHRAGSEPVAGAGDPLAVAWSELRTTRGELSVDGAAGVSLNVSIQGRSSLLVPQPAELADPLPAIVDPVTAGTARNGVVTLDSADGRLRIRPVAVVERFPGAAARFAIVDIDLLQPAFDLVQPGFGTANEVWIAADGAGAEQAAAAALAADPQLGVLEIDRRTDRLRDLEDDPLARSTLAILVGSALAAAVLAGLALIVGALADATDERALHRTLALEGVSPRRLVGFQTVKTMGLVLMAIPVGLVGGAAILRLVTRTVAVTAGAIAAEPALRLSLPMTVAGGMLLVFIATAACGACLGALPLRRVPATDLLRGGE